MLSYSPMTRKLHVDFGGSGNMPGSNPKLRSCLQRITRKKLLFTVNLGSKLVRNNLNHSKTYSYATCKNVSVAWQDDSKSRQCKMPRSGFSDWSLGKNLFPHWDYSHVRHRRSFRLVINRSFLFSTCGSFESPVSELTNHSYHGLARLDEPPSYPGPVDEGNFHINFLLGCIKWVYHMSFLQQCP